MDKLNVQSQLDRLELRARRLERRLLLATCGWLSTLSLFLFMSWTPGPVSSNKIPSQTDRIRVRELIVVDENGKDRIVIAAPIPDPVVNGKAAHRRVSASAGIQFKDANGNERGGIAALDDGSLMFGIDDEAGGERAHLYFMPDRGAGIYLQDGKESAYVSLLLPPSGVPILEMKSAAGKKIEITPDR